MLSRHCRWIGPHLALKGESRVFSRVASGSLGFPCNCGRDLRKPVVLPQGSEVYFQVVRGNMGLLSSHCRGIGPQLEMSWVTRDPSRVVVRNSGFLSNYVTYLQQPLELHSESRLLSSFERALVIALEAQQGKWASSSIERGISWFSQVAAGSLGFLSSCDGDSGNSLCFFREDKAPFKL